MCGGEASNSTKVAADVLLDAPHAGHWFHEQFVMLVENAYPPLGITEPAPGASAPPAYIDSFDDYATGDAPAGSWEVEKTAGTSLAVSDEKFWGLRGNSIKITAPQETADADSIAMLKLAGSDLGGTGTSMYGRMRVYVEDKGEETDSQWTLVSAGGDNMMRQWNDLQYRLGSSEGSLSAVADSNRRGPTCTSESTVTLPKETWACVEWQFDAEKNLMNFWVDGDLVQDLQITEDAPGCSNESWLAPDSWEELNIGVGRYKPGGQTPQDQVYPSKPDVSLFIDEVAVSAARLGCGTVRYQ